ncbi:IL-10-like protein [Goatpox virus]|uniref:Viral interleukin-10 homolog n=2 Tax=Goatpox virus TaxID=186805 RepID=A0A2Z4P9C2_9POXV|nr:IL-10 [Goatpox virus FZ]AWX92138.1 IL-10 [Goatpox virus]AWX92139.1 IL-10 [Goatpox virus]AWX92140.1 IL-10 [Goatpox virus]AWX92142.1 IL-10 [Goatpox virus]
MKTSTKIILFCYVILSLYVFSCVVASAKKCDDVSFDYILKDLRSEFIKIKSFVQNNDQENMMLLSQSMLDKLTSCIGCKSLSDMIKFYLNDVLPNAEKIEQIKNIITSIGEKLKSLKEKLISCDFLHCENNDEIKTVKAIFNKLKDKGIYKAMGEFDIFINYVEKYIVKT